MKYTVQPTADGFHLRCNRCGWSRQETGWTGTVPTAAQCEDIRCPGCRSPMKKLLSDVGDAFLLGTYPIRQGAALIQTGLIVGSLLLAAGLVGAHGDRYSYRVVKLGGNSHVVRSERWTGRTQMQWGLQWRTVR
jgi:hypothetical protein